MIIGEKTDYKHCSVIKWIDKDNGRLWFVEIEFNGFRKTTKTWERITGFSHDLLLSRATKGMRMFTCRELCKKHKLSKDAVRNRIKKNVSLSIKYKPIGISCEIDGIKYDSIRDVSRQYGISRQTIMKRIKRGIPIRQRCPNYTKSRVKKELASIGFVI